MSCDGGAGGLRRRGIEAAAERAGIRAVTMNSANAQDWDEVRGPLRESLKLRWWKMPSSGRRAVGRMEEALAGLAAAAKTPEPAKETR